MTIMATVPWQKGKQDMNLIDRDALPKGRVEWEDIAEAPTVDAVPISYIQQRIDRLRLLAEYEAEANGGYTGKAHTQMYELRRLINQWKGEQDG